MTLILSLWENSSIWDFSAGIGVKSQRSVTEKPIEKRKRKNLAEWGFRIIVALRANKAYISAYLYRRCQ